MSNLEKWNILAPLAEEVAKKTIDGFEIPFEAICFAASHWPDGRPVIRYSIPSGILLFTEGAHANYGYNSAADFSKAARRGELYAKTAEGAVSLGRARKTLAKPLHIAVTMSKLWFSLRFLAENADEAGQIKSLLEKIFPSAKIEISDNPLELIMRGAFPINIFKAIKRLNMLERRQKVALTILFLMGLLTMILSLLFWFHVIKGWIDLIVCMIFLIMVIVLYPKLSPERPLYFEEAEKSKKVE
ncbi:MAG: hypothetical protein ACOY3I_02470 [Verrucomicrobiota bacterium]